MNETQLDVDLPFITGTSVNRMMHKTTLRKFELDIRRSKNQARSAFGPPLSKIDTTVLLLIHSDLWHLK